MRVCLVNPPSAFMLDDRVFPPLGLLRVAASLREHEVVFCDSGDPLPEADVYGITATSPQLPAAMRLIPQGKTVLGGAHATMVAASAKRGTPRGVTLLNRLLASFDCVVAGDGELAAEAALHGTGLFDADNPKGPWYVAKQDEAPLPARELLDLPSYRYEIDGKRATSVVAQLGCPFGCKFCGGRYSDFYRRTRFRSVESVVREIEHVAEMGYEGVMFLDDELNVSPQMSLLMQHLAPMNLSFRGPVKASIFTDAQADAMAKAGFKEVLFGFESGSDRILKNIAKGSVADNTRALKAARAAGLRVKALMSIGHAGETVETVAATKDWLLEHAPSDFDCSVITPYPGTPYWDDAVEIPSGWVYTAKNGDRLYQDDIDYEKEPAYYKGIPGEYESFVWTDGLSKRDLVHLRDLVEVEVRELLRLPWPNGRHYDHSMGQSA